MRLIFLVLFFCVLTLSFAEPAAAQLAYQPNSQGAVPAPDAIQAIVKKTRSNEMPVRPDWYGLFLLWAKANPNDVLSGLRDAATFENFAAFMACDWMHDFRHNDVAWPQKQVQIVQKFNEHALNPQSHFRLLTYGVLGPYVAEQQQFVFKPLTGAAFDIQFPEGKIFGMEDDCLSNSKFKPQIPWPHAFLLGFANPDFITTLPMDKIKAEYFLNNLPKTEKGELDRRLVIEVEFEVAEFFPPAAVATPAQDRLAAPVHVGIIARRAIVYTDANRTKELARFGFPTAPAQ